MLRAVIFDLDGVILHYDPARLVRIAAAHDRTAEAFTEAAFAPEVLERLVTGRLSHGDWVSHVGHAVGSVAAAAEWLDGTADVDEDVLALMGELRAAGLRVGVLTNGTDRTVELLADTAVPGAVDALVCTAHLGVAKPDAGAYQAACAALGVDPGDCFFIDDTPRNVDGARQAGLHAEHFVGIDVLRSCLIDHGALPLPLDDEAALEVREVEARDVAAIHRIARRMRLTLQEVVGAQRGGAMYADDWLRDRARQHLDGRREGTVWEAWLGTRSVGHTIVRVEHDDEGPHGLFSTTWVAPGARRRGVAARLLDEGEGWMRSRGLERAATHTATSNAPLVELYEGRGYGVVLEAEEMLRLERSLRV